jgi:hypothetical protein
VTIAVVIGVIIVVRDRSEIVAKRFVSCLHGHGWTQLTKPNRSFDTRAGRLTTGWSQLASSSEPGYAVITPQAGGSFTLIAVGGNGIRQASEAVLRERVQVDPSQFVGVLVWNGAQRQAEAIESQCLRSAGVRPMP